MNARLHRRSACPYDRAMPRASFGLRLVLALSFGLGMLAVNDAHAQPTPDAPPPPSDAPAAPPPSDAPAAPLPSDAPAPATDAPPTTDATPPTTPPLPTKPPDSFDFDLLGGQPQQPLALVPDAKKLEHERKVKLRRRVLTLHQGFGFTTLALLAVTLVVGQLNYLDKYGGGDLTGRYQPYHLTLAITSSAMFAATGSLALIAPNPFKKEYKADRAMLHKVMMALATAGMAAQLVMGPISSRLDGNLNQRNLALGHLVTGYATWAFMATGMLAFVF